MEEKKNIKIDGMWKCLMETIYYQYMSISLQNLRISKWRMHGKVV